MNITFEQIIQVFGVLSVVFGQYLYLTNRLTKAETLIENNSKEIISLQQEKKDLADEQKITNQKLQQIEILLGKLEVKIEMLIKEKDEA